MMPKLNFQQPLFQSSLSQDPSKIRFCAQETFIIISNSENSCVAQYFGKTFIKNLDFSPKSFVPF